MPKPITKAKEAANALSDFANIISSDTDEFAEHIMNQHRTIQQSIFGIIQKLIVTWAKEEHYDARNEHTIMACRNLLEAFPDLESRFPPLI